MIKFPIQAGSLGATTHRLSPHGARENEMPRARDSLSWPAELLPTRRADGVVLVLDRFDHQLLIDLNPPAPLNILAGQNTLHKRMSRR